jgi:nicotinate-nucleotide adenylyltransferase
MVLIDGQPIPQGQRVGLLGGSFDPPHSGHLHVSRLALLRFGLDRVVWLVSPANPLKRHAPAPLEARMGAARGLIRHPRIAVSDYEARKGTRFTAETLAGLRRDFPRIRFVWLMGADNLAQLHRWEDWKRIMHAMPMGVLARPGARLAALTSPAAQVFDHARLPERAARALPFAAPPRWCFVNLPMVDLSSTTLRAHGAWQTRGAGMSSAAGCSTHPGAGPGQT